ncbi:MAG: DNA repair protein RecO [Cycloclasticus sp. symbiont of Poecilosclerida sp. N]|nr:MAG: DNA repair protein RecO [Cycloclasticus sp. symbiont of Poecilosclerida sp. N]
MNKVHQQPGFILKSQAFKESSFIHQVFTQDYGLLSVISKGSRGKNSKHGSLLQAFRPLSISWVGKSELKTLTSVDETYHFKQLKGNALYCGLYVNELILNLIHKHDAHPRLFQVYMDVIGKLSVVKNVEPSLRQFEKCLFDEIGYGLSLQHEAESGKPIEPDAYYVYRMGLGAVAQEKTHHADVMLGSTLINLASNKLNDKTELAQAKRMMRRLIDAQLDGKILKSRGLFV